MKIKFYRKDPEASETAIFASVCYDGKRIKIYTGESINPKFWNPDTHSARNSVKFTEHPEFNQRLNNIRGTISKVFLAYRNKHDHGSPSPAVLKSLVEAALKKGTNKTSFLSFFKEFANRTMNGDRVDPRTKKRIKGTGGKGYLTTLAHLEGFCKENKKGIDFDSIDLTFYDEFTKYLSTGDRLLSLNTIGSHIQRIKAVMREAYEKGLTTNTLKKGFAKVTEEADTIYLDESEIKALEKCDFSETPNLEKFRDFFLVGCYTGLRFSDFSILKPGLIKDGYIKITQTKTGEPVTIPVHPEVKRILHKYKGATLFDIFNVSTMASLNVLMNSNLKEIGKLVPALQIKVEKRITKGGVPIIRNVKKWELLSSHAARRSFATNEYNAGTPTLTIMAITGHKTEKAFLKYIRISSDEHAKKLGNIWKLRYQKTKLKVV